MKKKISLAVAVIVSLTFIFVSGFAENNSLCVRDISSSASTVYMGEKVKTTILKKNCIIKKSSVSVKENEMLFIGNGITLCLYKGAKVDGKIYIENGGELLLSEGNVTISDKGMILSDGTVKLKGKALMTVKDGGEVFIGSSGTLNAPENGSLDIDSFADLICIGKTNSKNKNIMRKPAAAYVYNKNGLEISSDPAALLPDCSDYMRNNAGEYGEKEKITFIFNNGHGVEVNKINDKISSVDGFPAYIAGQLNERKDNNIEFYSRIYEINDCDYVYDMKGISTVLIDENSKISDYDIVGTEYKSLKDAFKNFSKNNYIGKLDHNGIGILPSGADMYLCPDGNILVIWKYDSNTESLPEKYLNEPQETLNRLYYAAMIIPVDR